MPTSESLNVAFVWHMHQPYYRDARTGVFEMPWARLHALKDYLDMVEILSDYPSLHQTFNLVPSLVEQLEDYASGIFSDIYWDLTIKPASELEPAERAFVVERMCEQSDHHRARLHPRYLELARIRDSGSPDWNACAASFTTADLRDLQVWFNLAWFDPEIRDDGPLRGLMERGRDYREEDKQTLAEVQADLLARVLPAYREAAGRNQVELTTSPYFHPILPLLCNTDSARIASPDVVLPPSRFAHPEDAAEQIRMGVEKHVRVFGDHPRGMWCSEQAVGEDIIPLLVEAGLQWTISDEGVLARSLSEALLRTLGVGPGPGAGDAGPVESQPDHGWKYLPYRLRREAGEIAIVFRDHALSDLIGFTYQSWPARDAAGDLLQRLRGLRQTLSTPPGSPERPLVTIALDGENAWEYYGNDGHDFLGYLYEGLCSDESLRCVTVSEHLAEAPAVRDLDWLHTGSWIGADLRTWCGDKAHNAAWDQLGRARDLVAVRRDGSPLSAAASSSKPVPGEDVDEAWHHVAIAEGSDWFWWYGDHHHTELDYVWDREFRSHLQETYHCLGEQPPAELLMSLFEGGRSPSAAAPSGPIAPVVDGRLTTPGEWEAAGILVREREAAMARSDTIAVAEVRFGWQGDTLCLLIQPGESFGVLRNPSDVVVEVQVAGVREGPDLLIRVTLEPEGRAAVTCVEGTCLGGNAAASWGDVIEAALPLDLSQHARGDSTSLAVRVRVAGLTQQVFNSAGLTSIEGGER